MSTTVAVIRCRELNNGPPPLCVCRSRARKLCGRSFRRRRARSGCGLPSRPAGTAVEDETAAIQKEICAKERLPRAAAGGSGARRAHGHADVHVPCQFGFGGDYGLHWFKRVLEHFKSDPPLTYQFVLLPLVRAVGAAVLVAVRHGEANRPTGCRENMGYYCDEAELEPKRMQENMRRCAVNRPGPAVLLASLFLLVAQLHPSKFVSKMQGRLTVMTTEQQRAHLQRIVTARNTGTPPRTRSFAVPHQAGGLFWAGELAAGPTHHRFRPLNDAPASVGRALGFEALHSGRAAQPTRSDIFEEEMVRPRSTAWTA